jgi:hypothetical protein
MRIIEGKEEREVGWGRRLEEELRMKLPSFGPMLLFPGIVTGGITPLYPGSEPCCDSPLPMGKTVFFSVTCSSSQTWPYRFFSSPSLRLHWPQG